MDFDVIVIGSGFGGAITGCRLAQKGQKVLILERGKEWDKGSYHALRKTNGSGARPVRNITMGG